VKYWLPELMDVPEEFIHKPWRMPARVQREADCLLGEDYPEPMVHLFESAKENERRLADSRRGRDVRQKMLW
jgi:deoxyribodipyrimidine photo-lyase